jgi:hypothetical protein
MRIKLLAGQVAVLLDSEDNSLIAVLKPNVVKFEDGNIEESATLDARPALEQAVSEHNCCDCTLVTDVDFDESDFAQHYTFRLYNGEDESDDEYVKLTLLRTAIY